MARSSLVDVETLLNGTLPNRNDGRSADLSCYIAFERKLIVSEVRKQLENQPNVETKNRKPLRYNPIASWELRVGKHRIFYEVDEMTRTVSIVSVGHKSTMFSGSEAKRYSYEND